MPEEVEEQIDIFKSKLVPRHTVLTEEEKTKFLEEENITVKQLPKMSEADPVAKAMAAKKGDVIRILRREAGKEYFYYRVVH